VIGSASPVIEAVLNMRDAAHDGEEVAVAHAFREKVCLDALAEPSSMEAVRNTKKNQTQ
jgi:hypothetical protein